MLSPSVRIVIEGTGEAVATLPPFTSLPEIDQELALTLNGDPEVVYKVEDVRWNVQTVHQIDPSFPTKTGVNAYVELIVSVVP